MPTVTDWLMVVITLVYVAATIVICIANFKSAHATNAQLAESKKQFADTQRLQVMPCLYADIVSQGTPSHDIKLSLVTDDIEGGTSLSYVKFKNIGNGAARGICYKWINYSDSYDRGAFPITALQSGDEELIFITLARPKRTPECEPVFFEFTYEDLLGNKYSQKLTINFDTKFWGIKECIMDKPQLM